MSAFIKSARIVRTKVFNTNPTKERLDVESQNLGVGKKFQDDNLALYFYENDIKV